MEETQTDLNNFLPKDEHHWKNYNLAKCNEKRMFYLLLDELCNIVPEPSHHMGRKPLPLRDLLFCACLKVYNNHSARRISSDMRHAQEVGYIKKLPHFNSLLAFMNNEFTEELLKRLVTISAMPMKELETDFALDSTGFSTYQHDKWHVTKWSKKGSKGFKDWVKLHASVGTKTNCIARAEVTYGTLSDHNQLPNLVRPTSANFNAERYSADKAYNNHKNVQLIASLDAMPFIPFKRNVKLGTQQPGIWRYMLDYFLNNREKFDQFYHKRSNVETTFSMMKYPISPYIKSKNFQARKNEVLLKCVAHNLCCLVEQFFFFKIRIDFTFCDKNYICT